MTPAPAMPSSLPAEGVSVIYARRQTSASIQAQTTSLPPAAVSFSPPRPPSPFSPLDAAAPGTCAHQRAILPQRTIPPSRTSSASTLQHTKARLFHLVAVVSEISPRGARAHSPSHRRRRCTLRAAAARVTCSLGTHAVLNKSTRRSAGALPRMTGRMFSPRH